VALLIPRMGEADVLRGLFDEKIISVLNVFLDNQNERFSLSQISSLAKVNITTTLRIIDRLIRQELIELTVIGKSKVYRFKRNEKTLALNNILKKEGELSEFIEGIKQLPKVKKVVLESKTVHSAKVLIVGNFLPLDRIESLVNNIKTKSGFKIHFVEISEKQYEDMEKMDLYELGKKIVWERKTENDS
jgi:hypothetical protein